MILRGKFPGGGFLGGNCNHCNHMNIGGKSQYNCNFSNEFVCGIIRSNKDWHNPSALKGSFVIFSNLSRILIESIMSLWESQNAVSYTNFIQIYCYSEIATSCVLWNCTPSSEDVLGFAWIENKATMNCFQSR